MPLAIIGAALAVAPTPLLAETKPPLEVSLAASGALFGVKLIIDWTSRLRERANKA